MDDSRRYRDNAAECVLAAQAGSEPLRRKLHLSMAASWLSLARLDAAMDDLLSSEDRVAPVGTDRLTPCSFRSGREQLSLPLLARLMRSRFKGLPSWLGT
jgi:hypothetical protein